MTLLGRLSGRPNFHKWSSQLYNAFYPMPVRSICDDWIEAQMLEDQYRDVFDDPATVQRSREFTQSLVAELRARCSRRNDDATITQAIQLFESIVSIVDPYAVYAQSLDTFRNEQYLLASHTTPSDNNADADEVEFSRRSAYLHAQILAAKGKQGDYTAAHLEWLHNQSDASASSVVARCSDELNLLVTTIVSDLADIQDFLVELLTRWQCAQAQSSASTRTIPHKFQTWFDTVAFLLSTTRSTIHGIRLLDKLCRIERKHGPAKERIRQQMDTLFEAGFIVERQPEQVIETECSAVVRMLARNLKGLRAAARPTVTVSIMSENCQDTHIHEIIKPTVDLQPHSNDNHLTWSFTNIPVQKVHRRNVEVVLIFQARFGGTHVVTRSLPAIAIANSHQREPALATIAWQNAFRDIRQRDLKVPDEVRWPDLARMLTTVFKDSTGVTLSIGNLQCLYGKLMRTDAIDPYADRQLISFARLCKDPLDEGQQISFWSWFYAAMHMTADIYQFWTAGHIEGFMSKAQTKQALCDRPSGTGLVRISDSQPGSLVIAFSQTIDNEQSIAFCSVILGHLTIARFIEMMAPFKWLPTGETVHSAFGDAPTPASMYDSTNCSAADSARCETSRRCTPNSRIRSIFKYARKIGLVAHKLFSKTCFL